MQGNAITFAAACRRHSAKHLVYASSSSVYGDNTTLPFSEDRAVDHPISLYAASKKANELMVHTYSHLNILPTTGLRLFSVLWPLGPARHGALQVRAGHLRRRGDRGLKPRPGPARLHLH